MSHLTKALISPYHEGASNILAGRGPTLDRVLGEISTLNPDLEIPESPTVNDLATLLRHNELRRAGRRKVTDAPAPDPPVQLLLPTEFDFQSINGGTQIQLTWVQAEITPEGIRIVWIDNTNHSVLVPADTTTYTITLDGTFFSGYIYNIAPDETYLDSENSQFSTT